MKTELCHAPILLDEVELAMVFQVKVAKMTMRFDQLLKLGLLRDEIRLQKQDVLAAAVYMARGAVKTWALGVKTQVSLGPQTTLPNNDLHALEPIGHEGMVIREIK